MSLSREDVNIRSDPSMIDGPDRMAYASRPEPRHERLWINGQMPDETRGGNNGLHQMATEGFHEGLDSGSSGSFASALTDFPPGPHARIHHHAQPGVLPPRPGQSFGPSRPQRAPEPLQHDSCGRHMGHSGPSCRAPGGTPGGSHHQCGQQQHFRPDRPDQYSQYPGCACKQQHPPHVPYQPYWRHCDQQGGVRWT